MSVMQRILDAISQRVASLVGGAVASRVETMVVLEQVDQQDALEERARQLEKEGKADLAESLRRRILQADHNNPGAQGQAILASLCSETVPEDNPAMLEDTSQESAPTPKRRKRATRRSAPQPKATEETGNDQ
jgi:hypothetical protein